MLLILAKVFQKYGNVVFRTTMTSLLCPDARRVSPLIHKARDLCSNVDLISG